MHHFVGSDAIRPEPVFPGNSSGYRRCALSDRNCGAVHSGWGLCELDAGGYVGTHVQSSEKSVYVLEGSAVLRLDNRAIRLQAGDGVLIPVGSRQAWIGDGNRPAKWIDMNAPVSREAHFADNIFFVGDPGFVEAEISGEAHDAYRAGSPTDRTDEFPVGDGVRITMLVDQHCDAALHNMFIVDYEPGSSVAPHDHPLEEAYYIIEGEVAAQADDRRYTLKKGDFLWAGVGCLHAFVNRSGKPVRWLETQSPQLPQRHAYRFARDWDSYD